MLVKDIMNTNVISVGLTESAALAARLLSQHNIGALPVCGEDGKIKGIVTDRDIVLRCVASDSDPEVTPVREIMSRSIIAASPQDDVSTAARLMAQGQVRRIPVVSGGRVAGMVSLADLAVRPACDMEASKALSDISENIHRRG